ncbi:Necrosis inducing protein [Phytophthora cactorum]|nr:Necrosis inducing protein [Phytophthora cactorum]
MRVLVILAVVALTSIRAGSIDHDTVQPFAQPEPITDAEKAAVKFKPSLAVKAGCHPYLRSVLGSQVYSRSTWYEDKWAIMYAWYFPKDMQNVGLIKKATSASTYGIRYETSKPPKRSDIINGTTAKVRYDEDTWDGWHTIFQFHEEGEYQDLIQWNQLTDAAREALENTDFGDFANVPFNDAYFETNLKAASTYYVYTRHRYGGIDTTSHSIWE